MATPMGMKAMTRRERLAAAMQQQATTASIALIPTLILIPLAHPRLTQVQLMTPAIQTMCPGLEREAEAGDVEAVGRAVGQLLCSYRLLAAPLDGLSGTKALSQSLPLCLKDWQNSRVGQGLRPPRAWPAARSRSRGRSR